MLRDDVPPSEESSVVDPLRSLQERVLRGTLSVLAVAVPALSVLILVSGAQRGQVDRTTMLMSAFTLGFPLLWWARPTLGFRRSGLVLLGLLALTSFAIEGRGGVTVGSTSLNVLVLLLSGLFFGRRGAVLGLLFVVGLFVLAGLAVVSGVAPDVPLAMWDPTSATFWKRQCLALTLFGVAISATEVYIVEQLSHEAHRFRRLATREQQQRLALENSEREREREQEQLLSAQKALEESRRIEALARLAGGIAHDFNNALTVILGTAELLRLSSSDPAEVEARADELIAAAESAGNLTRQLLTLGRRQVSEPRAVPIQAFLERIQTAARRVLPSDIALLVEATPESVIARVDPAQLERALFNLILNARDAMPRGGNLTIGCRWETVTGSELKDGRYVALAVSDTGEGMAPEVVERIFEPFFTTKGLGVGVGLGLATVYTFANESGGDIRVASTLGAGTTITLRLPEGTPIPEQTDAGPLLRGEAAAGGAPLRVLIVEDHSDVRANMVRIIARGGFEVSEAPDGDTALAILAERNDFAVMCIDGVMPGMATGAVIARAAELAPSMRVLLCSGYLPEELLRRGVAAGRYTFLQKPFSSDELLSRVVMLVAQPQACA